MAPRITPDGTGKFRLRLPAAERQLLRALPDQAARLIDDADHHDAWRVFPVAYANDPAAEAEYRSLMRPELLRSHRRALEVMASSVAARTLQEEELQQWLEALEVLRLVLGTQLQVTEDLDDLPAPTPSDPRSAHLALYGYLSALQDEAVQALSGLLPDTTDDQSGDDLADWDS